ncbi:hypothetical protein [Candidatus Uabimicrobium amorphum]|uniref:Uncharacterized protein n=1 Tax=Uabimicrobium amorphum TaxID=2596890 RepID=A0A5S9F3Q3_UABAM|nr:hypothetical protein [Candidatus Uabimicrobium amorphum]BBM83674.1 hypothetical protein UABAM_02027 [Candidatus Uabimicrobium amorphum]
MLLFGSSAVPNIVVKPKSHTKNNEEISNNSEEDMSQNKTVPIASRKEWIYLAILILLAVGIGLYIVKSMDDYSKIAQNNSSTDYEDFELDYDKEKQQQIKPVKFEPNKFVEENILDSKYITTEAYYHYLHKILFMTDEDIKKQTDLKLGWRNLIKIKERETMRGKFMRITGELVKLDKEVLKGKYADQRKMKGLAVWRGVIFSSDGRLYLFTTTDPPEGIKKGQGVELYAMFFKIWIYETTSGGEAKNPYFLGKNIKVIPRLQSNQQQKITVLFLIVFAVICILLGYGIVYERQQAKKFTNSYAERKLKRLKEQREKRKTQDESDTDSDDDEKTDATEE